jgi:hypothetical protein
VGKGRRALGRLAITLPLRVVTLEIAPSPSVTPTSSQADGTPPRLDRLDNYLSTLTSSRAQEKRHARKPRRKQR